MAWKGIDDGAWTSTDAGPLASVASVRARDNAAEASAERNPATGLVFPADEPFRMSSVFRGCAGPFWIWLPKAERWDTIAVRVRIGTVEMEGASDGDVAAYITPTIGTRGNGTTPFIRRPPEDLSDSAWAELEKGESTADDGIALTSFSVSTEGARGWVGIFLWIQSEMRDTAETETTLYATFPATSAWLVEVLASAPPNDPPERAAIISAELDPTGTNREIGDTTFQLCSVLTVDAEKDELYVLPPPLPPFTAERTVEVNDNISYETPGSPISIHALGVVPIQSISIEAIPRTFEPSSSAFYSGTHAAEQWQHLAVSTNRLVNTRRKQWLCSPGPDSYSDGNHARLWPIRSDFADYDGGVAVDGTYRPLMSMTVLDAPDDDNGYLAIISLYLLHILSGIATGFSIRLAAYDGCDASPSLQASGEALDFTAGQIRPFVKRRNQVTTFDGVSPYTPMGHSIAGVTWLEDWQARGLLYWEDVRSRLGAHDWQRVFTIDLPTLAGAGLTYPIILRVEAQLEFPLLDHSVTFAVIGGAIRSRDIT
jgi:hypothetical protein